MSVMIKEINIKNLGPIPKKIEWELGKLNLIYGKNETGKTFLVEFLIRSLFKTKGWQLRPLTGSGKIMVIGLEDNPVAFSPSSSKKFDDYYLGVAGGLPPDFSKLLVVKGAEVELGEEEADKVILNRYLSSREILDEIEDRVLPTIREAVIENHEIIGGNRGGIKQRIELKRKLDNINSLFEEINSDYLGGQRKLIENKRMELGKQLEEMDRAKRYYAYTISKEIEEINGTRNRVGDNKLDDISKGVTLFWKKDGEIKSKEKDYAKSKEKSQHYNWAKNAKDIYEGLLQKTSSYAPNNLMLVPLIVLVVLASIFSFFNLFPGVIGSLVGLVIFVWLYIKGYKNIAKEGSKSSELEKINTEYQNRFGQTLTGLAQLKASLDDIQPEYSESEVLKKLLLTDRIELLLEKNQISNDIKDLLGKKIEPEKWNELLQEIKDEKKALDKKIGDEKEELIRLNVDKLEYITEEPSIEYNQNEHRTLETEWNTTKEQLETIKEGLNSLKARICQITNDDPSISWEGLIQNLREKHKEKSDEYSNLTAQIIGKIAVIDVVKELRKAEDEKIKENLESDIIKKPLFEVTNRYTDFRLDGDNLYVLDEYGEFPLNQVSTGAKEQVFLALRMGFCSRILKQDSLFLILDDAFQYSDWDRRQLLANKAIELVKNGWQIIYFTMDNNIKELFDAKGKALGTDYKNFTLAEM